MDRKILLVCALVIVTWTKVSFAADATAVTVKEEAGGVILSAVTSSLQADKILTLISYVNKEANLIKDQKKKAEIEVSTEILRIRVSSTIPLIVNINTAATAVKMTEADADPKKASDHLATIRSDLEKIEGQIAGYNDELDKLYSNVKSTKSGTVEPGYRTKYFYLAAGAVALNPYKITKDPATNKFFLDSSGTTETNFFTEALVRHRGAWTGQQGDDVYNWTGKKGGTLSWDGDFKIGFTSSNSKDTSGAVVSGSGDAYLEASVTAPWISNVKKEGGQEDELLYSFSPWELIGGLVTDKGSQGIHYYCGIGPAVAFGIPFITDSENPGYKRKIEALFGLYLGQVQTPMLLSNTRELETRHEYPLFKSSRSGIARADVRLPVGKNGYITMGGRFFYLDQSYRGSNSISPWTVSIGYTIMIDDILSSVLNITK